jgi:hypothetical protein
MKLTPLIAAAALALTVFTRPASAGYDKDDVLEDLTSALYNVAMPMDPARGTPRIDQQFGGSTSECVKLAELAIEKGAAKDKVATYAWVPGATKRAQAHGDRTHEVDPAGAKAYCLSLRSKYALDILRANKSWFEYARRAIAEKSGSHIKLAKATATDCLELTGYALENNAPETEVYPGDALSGFKDTWCKPLAEAAGILADEVAAAEAAKVAPYKKVLKAGKLKIFIDEDLVDLMVFGKGEKRLKTPKDFANASLWFVILGKKGPDGKDWWILRRYQFKGDKFVKKTEKEGKGSYPPKSAYR